VGVGFGFTFPYLPRELQEEIFEIKDAQKDSVVFKELFERKKQEGLLERITMELSLLFRAGLGYGLGC
jgi:hypothetical protein